MKLLAIDTSTSTLSVSVANEKQILGETNKYLKHQHSSQLVPTINNLLSDLSLTTHDLTAVGVAVGPGSYTGIRIGVTVAKTLAWAEQIPLYSVSSLLVLAMNAYDFPGLIVPLIDARRERVYTAIFNKKEANLEEILTERVLTLTDLLIEVKKFKKPALFLGDALNIYQQQITATLGKQAEFATAMQNIPRAAALGILAIQKSSITQPESADFTPEYLTSPGTKG